MALDTSFSGPFNGMLGVYYLHSIVTGDYYVNAPTLDYPAIVLGVLQVSPVCRLVLATGCISGRATIAMKARTRT